MFHWVFDGIGNIKTSVDLPSIYIQFVGCKTHLDPRYSWMNQHRITSGCNMYAPIIFPLQQTSKASKIIKSKETKQIRNSAYSPKNSKSRLFCTFLFSSSQYWYMGKFLPTSRPLFLQRSQTWLKKTGPSFVEIQKTCVTERKKRKLVFTKEKGTCYFEFELWLYIWIIWCL